MAEILSEFGHLVGLAGGNNIQATTMPTYSSVPLGTIVQYIGTTTADYINGYFYKATATGWEQHDTQPASNADNSITAFKESSPALAAHAVDEYIRYNNVTYIVTAAITIGDNLVIGTNIDVPDLDEGTVIYTPEAGGINGVVDVLVDGQSVVDENGEAHINTPNASGIGYDNTASELEATNTQDAIDEVVETLDNKVDKVIGKGLSTNDYDNIDKAKVGKIDETTTSVSGNPISISGLKSNQLAKDPIITLEPIQAGSGDPSPSNVRAISGYDKIEVLSLRKNICPYIITDFEYVANLEGYVTKNGDILTVTIYSSAFNAGVYTIFSFTPEYAGKTCSYSIYAKANKNVNALFGLELVGQKVVELTTEWQQIKFENVLFDNNQHAFTIYSHSGECEIQVKNLMFELGSTCSEYEPYNPLTNIQLTLGQTIYGGTLDVEKGILTVDRGIVDLGTLEWIYETYPDLGFNRFKSNDITDIGGEVYSYNFYKNVICSIYKNEGLNNNNTFFVYYAPGTYSNKCVYVYDSRYTDATTFKTAMNGVQLVYELAEPYTIQLTPHEISLLKDYVYVSTNGTSIAFDYHNGELASLADVSQLGETVNELGDNKLDKVPKSISVTKQGTETYKQIIKRLYDLIDWNQVNEITSKLVVANGTGTVTTVNISAHLLVANWFAGTSLSTYIYSALIYGDSSTFDFVDPIANSKSDATNTEAASGWKLTLYY